MKEFTRTRAQIRKLPPEEKERAMALFNKLVFMDDELEKLQAIIREKGWTEEYQNGANQRGIKKCTEGEMYNVIIKNYTASLKSLNDMLADVADRESDELTEFLRSSELSEGK